jgi:hypothetical protein
MFFVTRLLAFLLLSIFLVYPAFGQAGEQLDRAVLDSLYALSLNNNRSIAVSQLPVSSDWVHPPQTRSRPKSYVNEFFRQTATCYDTSRRFYLANDSLFFYPRDPVVTKDGNLLITGQCGKKNPPYYNGGFLIKTDTYGNVLWGHIYDSLGHKGYSYVNYVQVIELNDGSLAMVGRTNNPVTGNDDIIVTKTTSAGVIIWNKSYKSRLWTSGNSSTAYFSVQEIKQILIQVTCLFVETSGGKAGQSCG